MDVSPGEGPVFALAVMKLAIGAPAEYDKAIFNRILAAIESPIAMDHSAGVTATMFTEWPEFLPVLQRVAATDENQQVRLRAERALNAFANAGIGEA
ncbi:MAG: hypothetical protein JO242_21945 [Streptosporangiaceae bacterium]|nr:hypothetical protein [Streptosporangiaceae bacterium]